MQRVVLLALWVSACATTGPVQVAGDAVEDEGPESARYFPIAAGNSWAYVVDKFDEDQSAPVLVTSRIVNVDGDAFELQTGDERAPYELRADGVFKKSAKYYLLKDPLEKGQSWPIMDGQGAATITKRNAKVTVPAGTFEHCVVVVEELAGNQRVEWTYARDVGPARMRVFTLDTEKPKLILDAKLKGFRVANWD